MRKVAPSSLSLRVQHHVSKTPLTTTPPVTSSSAVVVTPVSSTPLHRRSLANVQTGGNALPEVWFTSSGPKLWPERHAGSPGKDGGPPDERTLRLGKTLRVLQDHMPTLLQTPLPQEILSPHITLHLFPSTHPHLPTVSGRVAYIAALWTAPVAWGRVPIVGNVKIQVLSERMVKTSLHASPASSNGNAEKLIVRWKTCGKNHSSDKAAAGGSGDPSDVLSNTNVADDSDFSGLFIFEFDELGRVLHHTIEHADEGANWDRNTAKVISVTEWLLSKARGGKKEVEEGLALGCEMIERRVGVEGRRRD
ncbi:hypothetical protein GP486_000989 [Trichoglossum hirsutum]|uniref:Uncharacterized protein n=1 Tax=Trichoglossum hirsutum TaxID=265104 RepID=A0A9P8LHR1_9PEZI|nr:hypothetical protein GP486_000989 [Trichoglossum hirsutum]